jgi:long-chain fatty acid transport protein
MLKRILTRTLVAVLLPAAVLLASAGQARASGFSIYEAGSRATALGCAFTATADDGSALFYNAAGLSFQNGRGLDLNFIGVAPQFKFSGHLSQGDALQTGESADRVYLVPGTAYTNSTSEKLAWGVGLYAPFGLGVEWKDGADWVGRRISHDVAIETVYVTPAVSYLAAEGLAVAVGVDIASQHLSLKKYSPENAIETEIEGRSKVNLTPSFGLMYRPNPKWSFGAMYHFEKTMEFEDRTATLTNVQTTGAPWAATLIAGLGGSEQLLSSELNLPSIMSLGAAYQASERLRLEGNYVRFGWSTFEKLALDFDTDALDQNIYFGYEDSWQVRFGAEYWATDSVSLMAGYVHDKTPQPLISVSPLLPDSDRNDYSFGVRYLHGNWDLNVSYMVVVGTERTNVEDGEPLRHTTDYPFGSYKSLANLFGVGLRYNF